VSSSQGIGQKWLLVVAASAFGLALYAGHPALALGLGAALALSVNRPIYGNDAMLATRWGRWLLQSAVVVLALRLDLRQITTVSGDYLPLVMGYVVVTLTLGLLLARLIRTDVKSGQLLAAATAICGGTAVASLAPIIRAQPAQMSPVLALVFLLNALAILTLPTIGNYLGMSQQAFGLWVGLAVHDTSSVLGTAAAYGNEALEMATTVKLGRTLWLIPLLAGWGLVASGARGKLSVPGFILLFVAVAALNGIVDLPDAVVHIAAPLSKWLLLAALFFIGLDLRRDVLRSISPALLLNALGLWMLVLPVTWLLAMRFV
jgi:uncharacterized integral membrane protein (TIGR00698 family)